MAARESPYYVSLSVAGELFTYWLLSRSGGGPDPNRESLPVLCFEHEADLFL